MTFQWKTTSLVSVQTWCHTSNGLGKRSGQTGRKSAKQIPWITECIDPWFDCPINLTPITLVQKRSSACVDQNSNRQIESLKLTFLIINWNKWVVCQFAIQHSWIRYKMPFLIYSDFQIKAFFARIREGAFFLRWRFPKLRTTLKEYSINHPARDLRWLWWCRLVS